MIGDGARTLIVRALGAEDASLVDRTLAAFLEHYAAEPVVHTTLLPGARDALAVGLPNALVTNKPRSVTLLVLERLGIAGAFVAIYAGGDGPLKPAPDGLVACCAQLGVAPADAWMIGDGPQDILAGKAAGCFTVAVPGIAEKERVLAAGPDLVVASLLELVALLAG